MISGAQEGQPRATVPKKDALGELREAWDGARPSSTSVEKSLVSSVKWRVTMDDPNRRLQGLL